MGKGSRRRLRQDRNASEYQAVGKGTVWLSYIQETHARGSSNSHRDRRALGFLQAELTEKRCEGHGTCPWCLRSLILSPARC